MTMNIFFNCCLTIIIFCILFGFYKLFKKAYYLALGNVLIPIFLISLYASGIMNVPSNVQVNEITYFVQELQQLDPFAVISFILHIIILIIFIWDIRTIMTDRNKRLIK